MADHMDSNVPKWPASGTIHR